MINRKFTVKIILTGFLILLSSSVFAQHELIIGKINCDSLYNTFDPMLDIHAEKIPMPEKSFAQIQNELIDKVDTSLLINNIYVNVYIDTLGNALCAKVIKGNNNAADTIALNILFGLKYTPGVIRGKIREKKFPMQINFPFYGNKVKETKLIIRKKGKWYDKSTEEKQ